MKNPFALDSLFESGQDASPVQTVREVDLYCAQERGDEFLRLWIFVQSALLTIASAFLGRLLPMSAAAFVVCTITLAATWLCPGAPRGRILVAIGMQLLTALYGLLGGGPLEVGALFAAGLLVLVIYREPSLPVRAAPAFLLPYFGLVFYSSIATFPLPNVPTLPQFGLFAVFAAFQVYFCSALARGLATLTCSAAEARQVVDSREAELRDAFLRVERAERAKNEFLANLSHEVRTPMNGVLGMTRILSETRLTAEQRELTETLLRSTKALLDVINEVLDFSRLEAGKMDLQQGTFRFQSPYDDVLELLGPMTEGKGLELLCELDSRVPLEVIGDVRRLRQVLINLVGNALKFTEFGHILIVASIEEESDSDLLIRTDVVDTGPGFTAEDQTRFFQPFSQGSGELVRKYGGTGLGLAIAKRLTEMMGGEIGARSIAGKGARFWFTVRCRRVPGKESFLETADLIGKRILILCHYSFAATIIASQLRQWGIQAFAAFHAEMAIGELVRSRQLNRPYDAVIVDGEAEGRSVADSWLERLRKVQDVPAILILPFGRMAGGQQAGPECQAVLTKPLRVNQLLTAIRQCLGLLPNVSHEAPCEQAAKVECGCILLVEDNSINQRVASRMLEKLGYRFEIVPNGLHALECFRKKSFLAILMDCQMPEMDGFEATSEIRKLERNGDRIPIIAMTALAMSGDRERCLAAGMDDYISKPVHIEELRVVLSRWIEVTQRVRRKAAGADSV
ncbi:MAG: response regulator [Bryobacterales bacterium]|nr:response regulator [Bryobacterales bacterium]